MTTAIVLGSLTGFVVAVVLIKVAGIYEFDRRCQFGVGLKVRYRLEGHRNGWKECRILSCESRDTIKAEKI